MPVYVYECVKKGHQFEVSQKMSDEPVAKCEVCGGKVQRLLFAPAIHFKGTGFHNTDYGTKKRPKDGAPNDGAAKGDTGGTSEGGGAADASTSSNGSSSDSTTKAVTKTATPAERKRRGTGP